MKHLNILRPPTALISILVFVLLWEWVCRKFAVPDYILPSPTRIFSAMREVGLNIWLQHIWATLRICLIGFIVSCIFSVLVAVLMTWSARIRSGIYPILVIIQSTPIVAIAPLLIVILGTEDMPRVIITFLITFFPLVISTTVGMLNTPHELIELSRSVGAPRYREFTQIRLPYAIPFIFSGMRIAITLAIVGTVVAEFVAAENGLGYYIQFSTSFFSIPNAFAGLILLLAISLSLFYLVVGAQRLLFPWSLEEEIH